MEDPLKLFILLFLLIVNFPLFLEAESHPNTLYVGGSGEGNYTTIQQAIYNASDGDIIYVYSGVYFEHLVVNKRVSLIGENRSTTIIDGNNSGGEPCIRILSPEVLICNFTIRWANWDVHQPGIEVVATNVEIKFNNISINDKGISLSLASRNCTISNNTFYLNHFGICGACHGGLYNRIENNTFIENDCGIFMRYAERCKLRGNVFSSNGWQGIVMERCHGNLIENNSFVGNGEGLILKGSKDNLIFHNNFIGNCLNALDNGKNSWDNGKEGNYWSNYKGKDLDGDGIGDEPYRIPGGENIDKFPFVVESGWIPFTADANGPYKGFVNTTICFHGRVNGGKEPFCWLWEFGDGEKSTLKNPCHVYRKLGLYQINLTVLDARGILAMDVTYACILPEDKNPPRVRITKPRGGIYITNRKVVSLRDLTIVIGEVDVVVNATDMETWIDRILILVDGIQKANLTKPPYIYTWRERCYGYHALAVQAFDAGGNIAKDAEIVFKID